MNAYCLLNHNLTDNQKEELKTSYNVTSIIYPPKSLKDLWSQIPAEKEYDLSILNSITSWLSAANPQDVLIVQGEFGSTFLIVDYALKHNIIPLHAVTKRVAKEEVNGETVKREYVFVHVCFRQYKYYTTDMAK